jgi:aspartate carbamoyltransferase catalytic subunit
VQLADPETKPVTWTHRHLLGLEDLSRGEIEAILVPPAMTRLGVEVAYHLDEVLPRCDVVNVLRIQFERQQKGLFPSIQEYFHLYGLDGDRLQRARPDLLVLAPGPINRGVELTAEVADGPRSAILRQVTNGLAVRMAVMSLLAGSPEENN